MSNGSCPDKELLVAHIYGEDSVEQRAAIRAHVARCGACAGEISSLRAVRAQLAEWQAPDVELGFRIVRDETPAEIVRRPKRAWSIPAWGGAAAAVLVLAVGAAVANIEVRYDRDGVVVRTGWAAPTGAAASTAASVPTQSSARDAWRTELAALEQRLRADMTERLGAVESQHVAVAAPQGQRDDLLRRVRALIEESEQRQQRQLALRLGQAVSEFEAQRRADLVRIEQNLGQVEGLAGQEVARQRELLNYLMRVSQRR